MQPFRLLLLIIAGLTVFAAASPARAEWRRAESERFIVYSSGDEASLRQFVRRLETFDFVVRRRLGLPPDPPARRFPIYLVRNPDQMRQALPGISELVAGIYLAEDEDIFAMARLDTRPETILHEYFHHLSIQTGGLSTYPSWLIEGLAEYYSTAEVEDGSVRIGGYPGARAAWLAESHLWIPLDQLVSRRVGEMTRWNRFATYYPVAWLMTHWFMNTPERRAMLAAYVRDMQTGADSVVAMERATGMTMAELKRALRAYMGEEVTFTVYTFEQPEIPIRVETLGRSADRLLLLGQRLKVGVPDDRRAATAAEVRREAARYPDDPFALFQLGHAELHFGDPAAGEVALERLLALQPGHVEALQLMAQRRLQQAEALERAAATPLIRQGRAYLVRAYEEEPLNYRTLQLLAESRSGAANYPNDNDLETWDSAFMLAPQLTGIRFGYARALMLKGRHDDAIALLEPVANSPHAGEAAEKAEAMMERARAGLPPLDEPEASTGERR